MPAIPSEVEQAITEGVKVMPSWGPFKILKANGNISGMQLVKCTSVFDKDGNFSPTFDDSIRETVEADQIIIAIGQRTDLSFVDPETSLKVERGLIVVDKETQATNISGVFAAGDITTGPASVIEAVTAGRRAAKTMDLYLRGIDTQVKTEGEKTSKH